MRPVSPVAPAPAEGGRSCASGGSEPPVESVAHLRSLVSFWATLLALSHTVVELRGRAGAKPAATAVAIWCCGSDCVNATDSDSRLQTRLNPWLRWHRVG